MPGQCHSLLLYSWPYTMPQNKPVCVLWVNIWHRVASEGQVKRITYLKHHHSGSKADIKKTVMSTHQRPHVHQI